jgi:hypothetical protein
MNTNLEPHMPFPYRLMLGQADIVDGINASLYAIAG